jgi:hypothetical protein
MAKLQIDGIEVADIDAAKAVQVLRLVRDNGPGMVVPANSRQQLNFSGGRASNQRPVEIVLPLAFAARSTPSR